MFKRLEDIGVEGVAFTVDGKRHTGRRGDTVAAALLLSLIHI